MKAIMLMDVIDKKSDKNYRKGQVLDVFYDSNIDECAVYTYYTDKDDNKIYRHWFPLFYYNHPEEVQIKITDNDGITLEDIRDEIIAIQNRALENTMRCLKIAFEIE